LEEEKAGVETIETISQKVIGCCEACWAQRRESCEEDIGGGLDSGLGEGEDVLGVEDGEGFEEEDGGCDEEDCEGAYDVGRYCADRYTVNGGGGAY